MIAIAMVCGGCWNMLLSGDAAIHAPAPTATSRSSTPTAVEARIEPGRIRYDHSPMASAIGIVHAMLNTPHALSLSELTTTSAIAASATVITNTIATAVAAPVIGLTCSRAILASERPPL